MIDRGLGKLFPLVVGDSDLGYGVGIQAYSYICSLLCLYGFTSLSHSI